MYSRYLNRTDGGKDPLPSRSRMNQSFLRRQPVMLLRKRAEAVLTILTKRER